MNSSKIVYQFSSTDVDDAHYIRSQIYSTFDCLWYIPKAFINLIIQCTASLASTSFMMQATKYKNNLSISCNCLYTLLLPSKLCKILTKKHHFYSHEVHSTSDYTSYNKAALSLTLPFPNTKLLHNALAHNIQGPQQL